MFPHFIQTVTNSHTGQVISVNPRHVVSVTIIAPSSFFLVRLLISGHLAATEPVPLSECIPNDSYLAALIASLSVFLSAHYMWSQLLVRPSVSQSAFLLSVFILPMFTCLPALSAQPDMIL